MPLATQLLEIGFTAGINSKIDKNILSSPYLADLQNAIFTKAGTLVKRNGFQPLGRGILGGGSVTTGQAIATFDRELLQFTSTGELYSYSDSQDAWVDRGASTPLTVDDTPIVRNNYVQSNPDADTSMNGVTVFAWEDTRGGVRATAVDEATGAFLLTDVSLDSVATCPRVVAVQNTLCVIYATGSTLAMKTLDALSPTAFSTAYTLDASMPASACRIAACRYDGASFVAAWNYSGQTRVAIVLPAGYTGSPAVGYPSPVNIAIASTGTVDVVYDTAAAIFWILGAGASGLYGATLGLGFVAGLAPTQITSSAVVVNVTASVAGTTLTAWWEQTGSQTYNQLTRSNTLTSAGVVGIAADFLRSVGLGSKVFTNAGTNFFLVNFSSPLQPTTFLVNGSTGAIVGKGQPYLSGGLLSSGMVPKAYSPAANQWTVAAATRVQTVNTITSSVGAETTYTSYFLTGIDRLDFYFNAEDCYRTAQMGGNLHLTGGVVQAYDGQGIVEHGFHLFPESFSAVASTSGGSMADGVYGITVVWYSQDARGQLFRSAPGVPISVTISGGGGNGSIALTIPTLRLTLRTGTRTPPIAAVFRTPVDGTAYQRVGNGAADPVTAPVYSSTTADTVSFSLTVADATIAANEFLYTTGGTLPNIAPGAASLIAASHNRIFLAGMPGQPTTFFYSQEFIQGGPVEFSAKLYGNVPSTGGPITAMATLDANTIFFKEASIYAISGEGPDSTGNNNQFTLPFRISTDVGCTQPESIAQTPGGLMFKTTKGLYLLDRSLTVTYLGAPAEAYNALDTTSGVLVDGVNQIRFTSADGVLLVYDYYFNQWGTFTNTSSANPSFLANDAVSWPRESGETATYAYLDSTGTVHVETPGEYLDNYTPVAMLIKTAGANLGNLQGFFKLPWVTVLGLFYSNHTLQVGIQYDYQDFVSETRVFTPNLGTEVYGTDTYGDESPYGGVTNTVYQFRFRPNTMKMESVQFTFTEQSATAGPGFALSGMTLLCANTNAPFKKLNAAATIAST